MAVKNISGLAIALFLSVAMVVAPNADTMEIQKFDQMNLDDRARYSETLLANSVEFLWQQKRDAEAEIVRALFKKHSSDEPSKGLKEFLEVLNGLRDMQTKDPSKTPHVEHAMAIVLKRHGVVITMNDFMQFAKDFKASE